MRGTGFTMLGLALAAAVVLATGCSCGAKTGEKAAEAMMEQALSQSTGGKAKVDLGGASAVDLSALPGELRFPGAKPLGHVSAMGEGQKGDTFILETSAPVAEVAAHFKKSLAGWKQMHAMEAEDMMTMSFESPDGAKQVSVVIGRDNEKQTTTMNITLMAK